MSKAMLYILNTIYAIFGVLLLFEGIAYFVYICMFTSLRNTNHYLVNFTLYWPQITPWVFVFAGLFVIFVSCCGCCSAKKTQGFTIMQASFTILTIATAIAAAVLALVYTDNQESVKFLKDALYDGFSEAKTNADLSASFSKVESWLQCCGVDGSSDYKWHSTSSSLPKSCCGYEADSPKICEYTSEIATDRHGCASVSGSYSGVAMKSFAATAVLASFFGLLSFIATLSLSLRKKRPAVYQAKKRRIVYCKCWTSQCGTLSAIATS